MPDAPLAQLVEQRTLNPQVLGSNPRGRTIAVCCVVLFFLFCKGSKNSTERLVLFCVRILSGSVRIVCAF